MHREYRQSQFTNFAYRLQQVVVKSNRQIFLRHQIDSLTESNGFKSWIGLHYYLVGHMAAAAVHSLAADHKLVAVHNLVDHNHPAKTDMSHIISDDNYNKYERTYRSGILGRRFYFAHQVAAVFCVKWHHVRHFYSSHATFLMQRKSEYMTSE